MSKKEYSQEEINELVKCLGTVGWVHKDGKWVDQDFTLEELSDLIKKGGREMELAFEALRVEFPDANNELRMGKGAIREAMRTLARRASKKEEEFAKLKTLIRLKLTAMKEVFNEPVYEGADDFDQRQEVKRLIEEALKETA